jgi:type I restriction enzyme S subunit
MTVNQIPLGEVATFIRGITFKPEDKIDANAPDAVVCMRTKNVQELLDQDDLIAIPPSFVNRQEQYLDEGDILVSTANSWELVGKSCWVPKIEYKATAGGFISILRANREKAFPRYLYHWMNSSETLQKLRYCGRQTTNISNMSFERACALKLPLPLLPEQKRIAAILDKADSIRRKRQEAVRLTEELLRSVFLDMFGDPVTNPKGWEIHPLEQHISFLTTGSRGWAEYYSATGSRFIRSLDVQMNNISNSDVVYVTAPKGAEADRTRVKSGDVLLTVTGSKIGRVAPVPSGIGDAYVSQHVAIIRLSETMNPDFLSMYLSLDCGGQRQINQAQYGQTKPGLNLEQIREFKIFCPPMEMQSRYVDCCEQAIKVNQRVVSAELTTDTLFNSLLQRTFKRELIKTKGVLNV